MKLTSYWLDTAEPAGDFRRNPVPPEADVAVVGAGFTGLTAALELAKQGASVALLEQHTVHASRSAERRPRSAVTM